MSEEVKGTGGAPEDAASGGHQEAESKDAASGGQKSNNEVVKRDTYLKTLGELKSVKSKFSEVLEEVEQLRQTKLEAEGNKDQLIDSLKKKIETLEGEKNTLAGNFVERSLRAQFEAEAMKQGIKKPAIMDRLVDYGSFVDSVDTQTFTADEMDVKTTVEQIKSEYPELFSKESPKINNRTPSTDMREPEKKQIDFNKMTREEANRLAEEIDRQEGKRANFITG